MNNINSRTLPQGEEEKMRRGKLSREIDKIKIWDCPYPVGYEGTVVESPAQEYFFGYTIAGGTGYDYRTGQFHTSRNIGTYKIIKKFKNGSAVAVEVK